MRVTVMKMGFDRSNQKLEAMYARRFPVFVRLRVANGKYEPWKSNHHIQ